jgi:hypothetical protein
VEKSEPNQSRVNFRSTTFLGLNHDGGKIAIGSDNYLYILTEDIGEELNELGYPLTDVENVVEGRMDLRISGYRWKEGDGLDLNGVRYDKSILSANEVALIGVINKR